MENQTIQKGVFRVCCAKPENLVPEQLTPSLVVKVCRDCGARHFEATADPGLLGIRTG